MSPITLTIQLSRHPDVGYQLTARARYGLDDEPEITEPRPVIFDQPLLLANSLNPQVSGEHLARQIFSGAQLRTFLHSAGIACDSHPLGLRLVISDDCLELHGYPWEQLLDPTQVFDQTCEKAGFWFRGQTVTFARRRPQNDRRRPLAATRHALRALVVIADPTNISEYGLSPIDVSTQASTLGKALEPFAQTTILARSVSRAAGMPTLANLRDKLYQQPHLVYLICHGTNREIQGSLQQFLWLEGPDGRSHLVPVDEVVNAFRNLSSPPPLVVIAACHSAGDEHRTLTPAQIGPALVDTGVGAVVAMRGSVPIVDVEALMPKLIERLAKHGRIDLALAEARSAMPVQAQWWRAVLFTRTDSGQIWQEVEGYEQLLKRLKAWQSLHRTRFGLDETEVRNLADLIATCAAFQTNREALLEAIEDQSDAQAIVQLLDQLWRYEDASDERAKIEQWLDDHPLDFPFTPARLAQLRAIFGQIVHAGIGASGLEHCLRLGFDHWGAPPQISNTDIVEWLNIARLKLGALELRHGCYQPLQAFCHHLAQLPGLGIELQADLRSWAKAAALDLGIDQVLPDETSQSSLFHAYLCLVVKPANLLKPYQIELSAFFFPGGPDTNQSNLKDWEPLHLDHPVALPEGFKDDLEGAKTKIIAYLKALLQEVQCRLMHRSLMVELFLPENLWEIGAALLDMRLSDERFSKVLAPTFPLGIRLTERAAVVGNPQAPSPAQIEHTHRWQSWKNHPILNSATCHWVRIDAECDPEALFETLLYGAKQCVIGLVAPRDPTGVAAAIREAGTPIAIWVEEASIVEPNLDLLLDKLLAHGRDLPAAVHQLRKQTWQPAAATQLGKHLTLLWDNPNRPPPALRLQPLQ